MSKIESPGIARPPVGRCAVYEYEYELRVSHREVLGGTGSPKTIGLSRRASQIVKAPQTKSLNDIRRQKTTRVWLRRRIELGS